MTRFMQSRDDDLHIRSETASWYCPSNDHHAWCEAGAYFDDSITGCACVPGCGEEILEGADGLTARVKSCVLRTYTNVRRVGGLLDVH